MIELTALTKPFEVKFEHGDGEFGFKFKQPTYTEVMKLSKAYNKSLQDDSEQEFYNAINELFEGFVGDKIVVKDEDGNRLTFKDLKEFLELPLPFSLLSNIKTKIAEEVIKKAMNAEEVEKKS